MLSSAIEKAQTKIESNNYGIRKNLLEYDRVNNEQREIIYAERRRVLDGESMRDAIFKMITDVVERYVDRYIAEDTDTEWDIAELERMITPIIPFSREDIEAAVEASKTKNELKHALKEYAVKMYEAKEAEFQEAEHIR